MIELGGDAQIEWMLDNQTDAFTILFENVENVQKVEMKTDISGNEKVYAFAKTDTENGPMFDLTSPELATAVKMVDAVKTTVVVTTDSGELKGRVVYHAH